MNAKRAALMLCLICALLPQAAANHYLTIGLNNGGSGQGDATVATSVAQNVTKGAYIATFGLFEHGQANCAITFGNGMGGFSGTQVFVWWPGNATVGYAPAYFANISIKTSTNVTGSNGWAQIQFDLLQNSSLRPSPAGVTSSLTIDGATCLSSVTIQAQIGWQAAGAPPYSGQKYLFNNILNTFTLSIFQDTDQPADIPTNVTATALNNSAIDLTWSAAANATGYSVFRHNNTHANATVPMNSSSYSYVGHVTGTDLIDSGLVFNSTYCYRVVGTNALGEGVASANTTQSCATTTQEPGDVSLEIVQDPALDYAKLTWSTPTGNVSGYNLTRWSDGYVWTFSAGTHSTNVAVFRQDVNYSIHAWNTHGNGPESNNVTVVGQVRPVSGPYGWLWGGNEAAYAQALGLSQTPLEILTGIMIMVYAAATAAFLAWKFFPGTSAIPKTAIAGATLGLLVDVAIGLFPWWLVLLMLVVTTAAITLWGRLGSGAE